MKTFKVLFYETHMAEKFIDAESVEEVKELLGITDENDVITDQDIWPHSSLLVEHGWVQDQIINIKDQNDVFDDELDKEIDKEIDEQERDYTMKGEN